MRYQLIVDHYGKIEHAKVTVAPLTLFVGDNNSGKSYLLSLIWALNGGAYSLPLFEGLEQLEMPEMDSLKEKIRKLLAGERKSAALKDSDFIGIINRLLDQNKQKLADSIFNVQGTPIGAIRIEGLEDRELTLQVEKKAEDSDNGVGILGIGYRQNGGIAMAIFAIKNEGADQEKVILTVIRSIARWLLRQGRQKTIYLPAARTGFMLAKDVINQVGRQNVYDRMPGEETVRVQPFPKPTLAFLDHLENLSVTARVGSRRETLVSWLKDHMVQGNIQYAEGGTKEILYVPDGAKEGIPMRSSSAVVTELAPLMLFLMYEPLLGTVCYEEPETCLHPQLQLQMGRLLIRMVRQGITVVATTHSDIILQHVNNMIKAYKLREQQEFLNEAKISEEDCLAADSVAVYQFTNQGEWSVVEELQPGEDGFPVPTFSQALMNILDQTTVIQDYQG